MGEIRRNNGVVLSLQEGQIALMARRLVGRMVEDYVDLSRSSLVKSQEMNTSVGDSKSTAESSSTSSASTSEKANLPVSLSSSMTKRPSSVRQYYIPNERGSSPQSLDVQNQAVAHHSSNLQYDNGNEHNHQLQQSMSTQTSAGVRNGKRGSGSHSQPKKPRRLSLKSPGPPTNASLPTLQRRMLSKSQIVATQDVNRFQIAGLHDDIPRPYLCRDDRERATNKAYTPHSNSKSSTFQTGSLHVDLVDDELQFLSTMLESIYRKDSKRVRREGCRSNIHRIMKGRARDIPRLTELLLTKRSLESGTGNALQRRSEVSLLAVLQDAADGALSAIPSIMRLIPKPETDNTLSGSSIDHSLLSRTIYGDRLRGTGRHRIRSQLARSLEDTLARRAEWSDCSGDIVSMTWTPDGDFICGAITHSDTHNQQYNKAGNLVHGSAADPNVYSVSDHRIPRPIVETGENSIAAMRETQGPWLYSSVTCTAYKDGYFFTGSFDGMVKIWQLDEGKLVSRGNWEHDGHVNFVVTFPHHDMIATAADVGKDAVRVYDTGVAGKLDNAVYCTYSGEKADELALARQQNQADWAYHVATLAWGKSSSVENLLLVGYSPRSYDCHEASIPEERAKTGELCLWNVKTGTKVSIAAARTQNVFEVIWHPFQPVFVAATSPTGMFEEGVRTQLRLFAQTKEGSFTVLKTIDCTALDINEITIKPISKLDSYVTASCTDGCTYVWDTAYHEEPIHVLEHGDSIDVLEEGYERDEVDEGVRFAAWGPTAERFYTGSSDGVLKAWDVRAPEGEAHVRDVMKLSGGVYAGAFSDDFERLLIGDATGKIHLLSIEDEENATDHGFGEYEAGVAQPLIQHQFLHRLQDRTTKIRRPIVPHSSVASTTGVTTDHDIPISGVAIARDFLDQNQLVLTQDPYIGVVQGPDYAATGLFRADLHKNSDPTRKWRRAVREQQAFRLKGQPIDELRLSTVPMIYTSSGELHESNREAEETILDIASGVASAERQRLQLEEGIDFDFWSDTIYEFDGFEIDSGSESCEEASNDLHDMESFEQELVQELLQSGTNGYTPTKGALDRRKIRKEPLDLDVAMQDHLR